MSRRTKKQRKDRNNETNQQAINSLLPHLYNINGEWEEAVLVRQLFERGFTNLTQGIDAEIHLLNLGAPKKVVQSIKKKWQEQIENNMKHEKHNDEVVQHCSKVLKDAHDAAKSLADLFQQKEEGKLNRKNQRGNATLVGSGAIIAGILLNTTSLYRDKKLFPILDWIVLNWTPGTTLISVGVIALIVAVIIPRK